MVNVIRIARLTLEEMIRRRLVVTALILTAGIAALSAWGFHALAASSTRHDHPISYTEMLATTATFLVLIAYMFNLFFALGGAFVAAPAIANDVESGALLPIVTRPVRRVEIVIGKYLGIASLLCAYAFVSGFLEFGIVRATTGYWPPHPFVALVYLCGVGLTMLTVALFFSSRLSSIATGIAAVVLYGGAWICGIVGDIGSHLHSRAFANVGTISQLILPSDAFWRAAAFHLEPAVLMMRMSGESTPFFVTAPPPTAMILWACAWICAIIIATCWSFAHRDL